MSILLILLSPEPRCHTLHHFWSILSIHEAHKLDILLHTNSDKERFNSWDMDASLGRRTEMARKKWRIFQAYLDRHFAAVLKQLQVHVSTEEWERACGEVQTNMSPPRRRDNDLCADTLGKLYIYIYDISPPWCCGFQVNFSKSFAGCVRHGSEIGFFQSPAVLRVDVSFQGECESSEMLSEWQKKKIKGRNSFWLPEQKGKKWNTFTSEMYFCVYELLLATCRNKTVNVTEF